MVPLPSVPHSPPNGTHSAGQSDRGPTASAWYSPKRARFPQHARPRGSRKHHLHDLLVRPSPPGSHGRQVLSGNIRDGPSAEETPSGGFQAAWDQVEADHRTRLRSLDRRAANAQEVPSASYHCVSSASRTLPKCFDRERLDMQDHPASSSQALHCIPLRSEHGCARLERLSPAGCTGTSPARSVQGTSLQRST